MIRAGEEVDDANVVRLRRFAMSHLKSPVDAHSAEPVATTKKVAFKQLKLLLLPVLRWAKGLIDAQKLPHLADKACEVYLGEADRVHQDKCRQLLRTRLELNPVQLQRFFHTSVGDTLITWFGRFFHLPLGEDNQHTLKALLLQMAAEPDGLSLLSFLRRFPEPIQLNIDQLLFTAKRVELLLKETDAAIAIIAHCAIAES
ncbi:MAG TPA: alpha/beta hydrolase, partial [Chroococcidiopsis sp.]